MRVCDRCGSKEHIDQVKISINNKKVDQFELCNQCIGELAHVIGREFLDENGNLGRGILKAFKSVMDEL